MAIFEGRSRVPGSLFGSQQRLHDTKLSANERSLDCSIWTWECDALQLAWRAGDDLYLETIYDLYPTICHLLIPSFPIDLVHKLFGIIIQDLFP